MLSINPFIKIKIEQLRKIALLWAYFIGIGAVIGTLMMLIDPTGIMWGMEPLLALLRQGLPMFTKLFDNFIASGIVLFLVNGLTNCFSILLIHKKKHYGSVSGMICGSILMLWIILQFVIFTFNPLSAIYFVFGALQYLNSLCWYIQQRKVRN